MKNLLKSLAAFNAECPAVSKSADNPFFKSKYATLDAIQNHIKPHLAKNGLVIVQANEMYDGGMPIVKTTLFHVESGESISSVFPVVVNKQTAQDYGSAVSYAKRYSLSGLLNLIIEDEDDDGNKASGNTTASKTAPDPAKPWLDNKNPNWAVIVQALKDGQTNMTRLRDKYKISKAVEAELTAQ
jgi:hypothetical protein